TLNVQLLKEYARECLGWKGKRLTQKKPLLRADILEHLRWEQEMEEDQLAEVGVDEADEIVRREEPQTARVLPEQEVCKVHEDNCRPTTLQRAPQDGNAVLISSADLPTLAPSEKQVYSLNKRIQAQNRTPEDFPGFVRTGFDVKVVGDGYSVTPSGLFYKDFNSGQGPLPIDGQEVVFQYTGYNESGAVIDTSYRKNRPAQTRLGIAGLIPGFEEGIRGMKAGQQRRIVIPPALGPPVGPSTFFSAKQCEVFDIELIAIKTCERRQLAMFSDVRNELLVLGQCFTSLNFVRCKSAFEGPASTRLLPASGEAQMRRIFGAPKKDAPVATIDETTDKLVSRGDRVDEQIKKLDEQLMKYKEQIKKTRPGPAQDAIKRRALQVLKQKKLYEGQRDQLYQQQFNMEQTRFTVDSIKDTITTVQALSIANKEMKSTMKKNKELDLNYIDKLQDDMFDMMDMSKEINEAMSRSYEVPEDVDESDLMAELDGLEEELSMEAGAKGATPSYLQEPELDDMPVAPTKESKQDEREAAHRRNFGTRHAMACLSSLLPHRSLHRSRRRTAAASAETLRTPVTTPSPKTAGALKEWAVAIAALAKGEQTILVRKGGIREPTFKPPTDQFILFPTSFHSDQELLKPGVGERYTSALALEPKQQSVLELSSWVQVTGAWVSHDERLLDSLEDQHIWSRAFLEARLQWRAKQPLTLLELRTWNFAQPLQLQVHGEAHDAVPMVVQGGGGRLRAFAVHASPAVAAAPFLDLGPGLADGALAQPGALPALNDWEFAERQAALRQRLAGLDIAPLDIPKTHTLIAGTYQMKMYASGRVGAWLMQAREWWHCHRGKWDHVRWYASPVLICFVLLCCDAVLGVIEHQPHPQLPAAAAASQVQQQQQRPHAVGLAHIGKGIAETLEYVFDPDTQIGVGINPGVTQAVSAASRVLDEGLGQLVADKLAQWKLTKGQVKHASGLNNARRDTERWLAPIKPHLQHLAAASSAGTSLEANLKHITVTLATWDEVWEVYLDPKWAQQRLRLYGPQDRALEQFFKKLEEEVAEVSRECHGHAKQLVVFFGAAGIGTWGGWGADAVLRACCKVVCRPRGAGQRWGRVVLVDEHRTTRVSSAVNGKQPCEEELNKLSATRPAGWKPPAGQVEQRLVRPEWSQQRNQPVRGLMWCPVVDPRKPPQPPCSSQAATPAAASEPGPSTPPPAKRSKRIEAEQATEPTQPTKGKGKAQGKAAKAKPAPQPGKWLDRDCNATLNMQRIGESKWRPPELCYWKVQGALPAKGKEYPGLGYKRLRDKPLKAQEQQPAVAHFHASMFAYAEVLNFPTTGILDHAMYSMQRVLPVPPALSSRIRAKFFPAQLRDGLKYKTFLARLYLGKYPQPPPESCNFPLTAEMLDELGLPVADIAEGMGRLLSRIHYLAGQDGRDIEFVLGGDKHDRPKFFCIDFDQMRDWDDVQQLVTSFTTNDPYYPRPGMMYWDAFKSAYLDEAPISASASARQFVERLEQ
ncbi:hypothetical protein QJQ45_019704, partial [Haematococcus lacustris]